MREAEDVVDKEQHVLTLKITEVLCDSKTCETNTRTSTWGFVHLAINKRAFRFISLSAQLDHATFDHFVIKVISFPSSLSDPSED